MWPPMTTTERAQLFLTLGLRADNNGIGEWRKALEAALKIIELSPLSSLAATLGSSYLIHLVGSRLTESSRALDSIEATIFWTWLSRWKNRAGKPSGEAGSRRRINRRDSPPQRKKSCPLQP
jgi:hypothetical protein